MITPSYMRVEYSLWALCCAPALVVLRTEPATPSRPFGDHH
jgi:hypothetical protein